MKDILLLIISIALLACNTNEQQKNATPTDTTTFEKTDSIVVDSITKEAYETIPANKDSLLKILGENEFQSRLKSTFFENFTFLSIHNWLAPEYRTAIIVSDAGKDKYRVEIFNNKDGQWTKADENTIGYLMIAQLVISNNDYNFDGLTDLYIQATMSNGIGISHGHLLTQNTAGNFTYHPKYVDLGNMQPNDTTKTISSVEYIYCADGKNRYPGGDICTLTHQWKNGKLVTVKKNCPCKP